MSRPVSCHGLCDSCVLVEAGGAKLFVEHAAIEDILDRLGIALLLSTVDPLAHPWCHVALGGSLLIDHRGVVLHF